MTQATKDLLNVLQSFLVAFCLGVLLGGLIHSHRTLEAELRTEELIRTQRMAGTTEFAAGWNAAMDNLEHHLREVEE